MSPDHALGTLGIYFFEARWLDPKLGRFLSADTIIPDTYNCLDWDRYSYLRHEVAGSIVWRETSTRPAVPPAVSYGNMGHR